MHHQKKRFTILITGSSGLIGTRVVELLSPYYDFIALHQENADITDKNALSVFTEPLDFDFILHLAAYTSVDGAEKEEELAYKINVEGTRNLLEAATNKSARMIYTSTDFVFSGELENGIIPTYKEDSTPNPIATYGKSKYEGEKVVKDNAAIVRLSYPYRQEFAPKKDFVRTIRDLLKEGKTLHMVTDALITPTCIDDIVWSLDVLLQDFSKGIYHFVGSQSISPFDAGVQIATHFGFDTALIKPISYEQYFKDKAKRPQWARIVNTKSQFTMQSLAEGLNCYHGK